MDTRRKADSVQLIPNRIRGRRNSAFYRSPGGRFCYPGSPGESCGRLLFSRRRAHRLRAQPAMAAGLEALSRRAKQDRKSVVLGKSVDLGGRRIIIKKKKK